MSRLDRHIALVRSKLTLGQFLAALAYTSLGFFAAVGVAILFDHLLQLRLPHPWVFFWAGVGLAVVLAFIHSLIHKPTAHDAAVAIDEKLGLKEKFSTALFVRNSNDAFATAAVRDAEKTADNVSLHKRFPLSFPRMGYYSMAVAGLALLATLLPNVDLFGREAQRQQLVDQEQKRVDARHVVEKALATVSSYPKSLQSEQAIQIAQKELKNLLDQPIKDPAQASRSAYKALEEANEAVKEEIKKNQQYANAQSDKQMFQTLDPPPGAQGPVADAQRELAKGNFDKASEQIDKAAEKFNQMSEEQKQKAAQQMQQLAKQLQQMAQNPAQQKQLQQKLQQMGANQQQAQQIAKAMQQAAQGNPKAQQQLQQLQKQLAQQMNGGKGMTPQQQSAMQQLMKQGQAAANAQANAQQMSQAAQQMAQAMQQAASQQGQPGGQKGQQAMAQAQQQMQQAMGQMDAMQKDAEQVAAAQDATQQAADDAAGQLDNPGGNDGDKPGNGGHGQWKQGDTGQKGNGMGSPGIGNGGVASKEQAPYGIKQEMDPSQNIDNGKILASTFVKADPLKNQSTIHLSQAAKSAIQDSTDEVDEQAVSKESQKVVKSYFETMEKEQ